MHSKPDEPKTEATIATENSASAPPRPGEPQPIGALLAAAPPASPLGQLSLLALPGAPQSTEQLLEPAPRPKGMSKRMANNVLSMASAMEARRDETQSLAFSPEDFIRFGLPYKKVEGTRYERRNGGLLFRLTAEPEYGIPYGQDRLLPIWLATAFYICGQPDDGTFRFRSVRDILLAFGRATGGFEFRSLKDSIYRLANTTVAVFDERRPATPEARAAEKDSDHLNLRRYVLIEEADLWFDKKPRQVNQYTLWQNTITLSRAFTKALKEKVMPLDLDTVRALKDKPMALDLYVWQAHRSWELHQRGQKSVSVPVFGDMGLLAQLGTQIASVGKARQVLRINQKLVEGVWKGCPNHLTNDGNRLVLRPAAALKDAKLSLPGVSSRPPVQPLLALSASHTEGATRVRLRRVVND